ncbi:hypothetical protein NDU88_003518 [Pleurodeles waltl]|uniref:Uncharacterized protein n=1 Tax=Pleurodeles waltl TaxID=8319 RepID=A0AAV7M4J2_PLEWA|nr:hypothetical protein NDU88_003518 [Pleurodeles waltl]
MNLEWAPEGEPKEVQVGHKVGPAQNPHVKYPAPLPALVSTDVEWGKLPQKRCCPTLETAIQVRRAELVGPTAACQASQQKDQAKETEVVRSRAPTPIWLRIGE